MNPVSRNCRLMSPKIECCLLWSYLITPKSGLAPRAVGLNEALPVLNLYYNQAQSSQHPKRGTASTKLVLQSSTNPASIRNEILPALKHQVDGSGQR